MPDPARASARCVAARLVEIATGRSTRMLSRGFPSSRRCSLAARGTHAHLDSKRSRDAMQTTHTKRRGAEHVSAVQVVRRHEQVQRKLWLDRELRRRRRAVAPLDLVVEVPNHTLQDGRRNLWEANFAAGLSELPGKHCPDRPGNDGALALHMKNVALRAAIWDQGGARWKRCWAAFGGCAGDGRAGANGKAARRQARRLQRRRCRT